MVEMPTVLEITLFSAIVFALLVVIVILLVKNREWKMKFEQKVRDVVEEKEEEIRRDAIARSSRTLSGKTLEKLVPFLDRFKHDPHDVRWVGDPVDLVVFDGYSEGGRKNVDKITFVEVKSGDSKIQTGQRSIRDAVNKKKVKWEEFRV